MATRTRNDWTNAMARAEAAHVRCLKLTGGKSYAVMSSKTDPGAWHTVTLNEKGKITHCSDCPGWDFGVCVHAGAVARRLLRERFGRAAAVKIEREQPAAATAAAPVHTDQTAVAHVAVGRNDFLRPTG